MKRKFRFQCTGCRVEVMSVEVASGLCTKSWENASELLGNDGWRVVHVVRGERRAWVLLCDECAPMVLEQVAQSAAAAAGAGS